MKNLGNNRINKKAVIFDYGFGNVRSVQRAIEHLGLGVSITNDYNESLNADYLIVPGVGNFGECMRGLMSFKGDALIRQRANDQMPVLGICVGHQILFDGSMEATDVSGLGIIHGEVQKIDAKIVPHMGWNTIDVVSADFTLMQRYIGEAFYFVHSYAVLADIKSLNRQSPSSSVATTMHENCEFVSAVQKGSITGFQFHLEKSGEAGLSLLESWLNAY